MATNQFGINTNQFGVATNQFGLAPSGSNGVLTSVTNSAFGTNAGGVIVQDQAFSARDQAILAQVRRAIPMQLLPGGAVNGVPSSSSTTTSGSSSTASGTSGTGSATTSLRNNIHFVVRDGVVTIVGFVPTLAERQRIEAAVAGISGVTQVMDNLRVRTGGDVAVTAADQALLAQVRQAVQPILVPAGTMTPAFSAREGVVTITGTAASQQESQQIEAAVAQIPGVVRVSNQLVAGNAVTGFSLNPARSNSGATNITGSAPLLPNNFNLPITNQVGASTNVLLPTSRRNAPSSVVSSNAALILETNTTPTTP
jgi:osmotically-inducible protein OsmY